MKSVALVLLVLGAAGCVWLTTHVEPYRVYVVGDFDGRARGWEVLLPWAAGPVLTAYGAPVLALACALGWVVAKTRMAEERQRLAKSEAAADAQMLEARRLSEEAKRSRERDQALVANTKQADVHLSRQAAKEKGQRLRAVGELKRRRQRDNTLRRQLADAQGEIERLRNSLPEPGETG